MLTCSWYNYVNGNACKVFHFCFFAFLCSLLCCSTQLNILYFPTVSNRYTAHCLALVSHMTDNQKTIFLRKVLTSDEILHMKIKYVALFFLSFLPSFKSRTKCSEEFLVSVLLIKLFCNVMALKQHSFSIFHYTYDCIHVLFNISVEWMCS